MPIEFMHHDRWDNTLFLHHEAKTDLLQRLLPPGLVVDTYRGKAYVGVVALSELGITPALPSWMPRWLVRLLAMSHLAVNVRTYVRPAAGNGPPGIYFFTLDCSHALPFVGARFLFRLPYRLAAMRRSVSRVAGSLASFSFKSFRRSALMTATPRAELEVEWETEGGPEMAVASSLGSLASFFVERYSLYNVPGLFLRSSLAVPRGSKLWRGSITHNPWPIQPVRIKNLRSTVVSAVPGLEDALVGGESDGGPPVIAHFSPGVDDIRFYFEVVRPGKIAH